VTTYAETLALVLRSGGRIDLLVENNLAYGVDWYIQIDFTGFGSDNAAEDFHDRLAALTPGCTDAQVQTASQLTSLVWPTDHLRHRNCPASAAR
jgi:hypothetical protein